jgi:hypothetical protein
MRAKVRNPFAIAALMVLTLGFYGWYWWFEVNRELMDFGRATNEPGFGDSPWRSTLAYVFGVYLLFIPTIFTIVGTSLRIQNAQLSARSSSFLNGWLAAFLWIFGLVVGGVVYSQVCLNRLWRTPGVGSPVGGAVEPQPAELQGAGATAPAVTQPAELQGAGATAPAVTSQTKTCPDSASLPILRISIRSRRARLEPPEYPRRLRRSLGPLHRHPSPRFASRLSPRSACRAAS